MDPWCIAKMPAHSGLCCNKAWYHTSACRRVLVKTNVLWWASTTSATSSNNCNPMCPAQGSRAKALGMVLSTSMSLWMSALTITPCADPTSASKADSGAANVALTPHTPVRRPSAAATCRIQDTANSTCTPRLDPKSSCHSSTTTMRAWDNRLAPPFWATRMCSDSGVVIRMSGRDVRCLAFSLAEVSPVRVPTSQANPSPSTMARAASAMSADKARKGATQISLTPLEVHDVAAAWDNTCPIAA